VVSVINIIVPLHLSAHTKLINMEENIQKIQYIQLKKMLKVDSELVLVEKHLQEKQHCKHT